MTRLLRTVRHLRPAQIAWRLRYALERRRNLRHGTDPARWRWRGAGRPALADDLPRLPSPHRPGPGPRRTTDLLAAGTIEHLGRSGDLDPAAPDWRLGDPRTDRLWTMLLHCHGWAHALAEAATPGTATTSGTSATARELFRHYVSQWIDDCSLAVPGTAALAWNSYSIATRIGWWVRSYALARDPLFADHPRFEARFLRSLWQQAAFLHDHIEWDVRANHLVRDASGLVLAGRFFQEATARRWWDTGEALAAAQAEEQALPDGCHFERSGKYHLEVMEDLLSVWSLSRRRSRRSRLARVWSRMARVLPWLCHPDGRTHLLNDSCLHGVTTPAAVLEQGALSGLETPTGRPSGGRLLAETGLAVWHGSPWTVFFDVGPVGPASQPGHGHADSLTVESSFGGKRLIVDPGTYGYDLDDRRAYDRSTEAHNTVCIDGTDSTEVWHIFRVGRRARPLQVDARISGERFRVAAAHDGYDHLAGRPRHHRSVAVEADATLEIIDRVEGNGLHRLSGGFLIAPSWTATPRPGGWMLRHREAGLRVRLSLRGDGTLQPFEAEREYHPSHGISIPTTRLGWHRRGRLPTRVVATFTPLA